MTGLSAAPGPLTSTQPMPAPAELPVDYPRHAPEVDQLRAALQDLLAVRDWPTRSWTELIEDLIALGRTDIPLARLAEGHIDALRILDQADRRPQNDALYGVWASRSQRTGIRATPVGADRLRLEGVLRFASGAGLLDRALAPVWLSDGSHLLIDLAVADLPVDSSQWFTGAMTVSRTHQVTVDVEVGVNDQIGGPDFYLQRPGFFPGGVGVAACWIGGAARVFDLVLALHEQPSAAQQIRLGRMRVDLAVGAATIRATAALLDRAEAESVELAWQALSTEARSGAAEAVRRLITEARLVTGPAGLAMHEGLAHAIPDLEMYVMQQNSDADASFLGAPERADHEQGGRPPWTPEERS